MVLKVSSLFSPPTGLTTKNGKINVSDNTTGTVFTLGCNPSTLYAGENFAVHMPDMFELTRLVCDPVGGGIVATTFMPIKKLGGMNLTPGGNKILNVPNAGGSSIISEVLSFEVLGRCFGAKLKKTEMEVFYFPYGGSITDYVCDVFHTTIGVSVTRAMKYCGDFSEADALHLLNKKLKGVVQSTNNSLDKWSKQILHVWSTSASVTAVLANAYQDLAPEVKANTVVLVTTACNADYIFSNG